MSVQLTDEELLLRLTSTEDSFVERKLFSDSREWLEAAVAFANTGAVGYPSILFIGVKDDGTPEGRVENLESIQNKFSKKLSDAFPQIHYTTRVLEKDGKRFLGVIIPGSLERPHFAGHAYVRDGDKTVKASGLQFARLVAERSSKAYEILRCKGQEITMKYYDFDVHISGKIHTFGDGILLDCNPHFLTIKGEKGVESYPLSRIEISKDNEKNRLQIEIQPP
jgi:predicted HTH transcriptional regulator